MGAHLDILNGRDLSNICLEGCRYKDLFLEPSLHGTLRKIEERYVLFISREEQWSWRVGLGERWDMGGIRNLSSLSLPFLT
jgi:hypothetical protein